jgi:O-succinylbenzoic acid--CoA ligase
MSSGANRIASVRLDLTPEGAVRLRDSSAEEWMQCIGLQLEKWFDKSDSISLQTSGSTGKPKDVQHKKRAIRASARATNEALKMPRGSRALLALPAQFVGGFMMLVRAMEGGWALFAISPSSSPGWSADERWDFLSLTPHQAGGVAPRLRPSIATLLLGGASVPQSLCDAYPPSTRLFESFGMTETISHFALRLREPGATTTGPFKCLPGITVSSNDMGCLRVHAPMLGLPELQTRDLISVFNDGAFYWKGRADNLINSGGILVSPESIEAILVSLNLPPFKVYGRSHLALGEEVVLRISAAEAPEDASRIRELVLDQCAQHLPPHHGVRTVEWGELVLSESGKILHPERSPS